MADLKELDVLLKRLLWIGVYLIHTAKSTYPTGCAIEAVTALGHFDAEFSDKEDF